MEQSVWGCIVRHWLALIVVVVFHQKVLLQLRQLMLVLH